MTITQSNMCVGLVDIPDQKLVRGSRRLSPLYDVRMNGLELRSICEMLKIAVKKLIEDVGDNSPDDKATANDVIEMLNKYFELSTTQLESGWAVILDVTRIFLEFQVEYANAKTILIDAYGNEIDANGNIIDDDENIIDDDGNDVDWKLIEKRIKDLTKREA